MSGGKGKADGKPAAMGAGGKKGCTTESPFQESEESLNAHGAIYDTVMQQADLFHPNQK